MERLVALGVKSELGTWNRVSATRHLPEVLLRAKYLNIEKVFLNTFSIKKWKQMCSKLRSATAISHPYSQFFGVHAFLELVRVWLNHDIFRRLA